MYPSLEATHIRDRTRTEMETDSVDDPILHRDDSDLSAQITPQSTPSHPQSYPIAITCLILLITCWIAKAEITQSIQSDTWNKPVAIAWCCGVAYSIFLPCAVMMEGLHIWKHVASYIWHALANICHRTFPSATIDITASHSLLTSSSSFDMAIRTYNEQQHRRILTLLASLRASCYLFLFYFGCGITFNISLNHTAVSINTAIYNSACIVVFILSWWILHETVTWMKCLSVCICMTGVILTSVYATQQSGSEHTTTVFGCIMVTVSMILYAIFEVIYKYVTERDIVITHDTPIPDYVSCSYCLIHVTSSDSHDEHPSRCISLMRSLVPSFLFLGSLGCFMLLLLWPSLFIADATSLEIFVWPSSSATHSLLLSMGLDAVLNICIIVAISFSSPLFVAVGTLLTIPASILADKFLHSYVMSFESIIGIILICIGFIGLQIANHLYEKEKSYDIDDTIHDIHTTMNTTETMMEQHLYAVNSPVSKKIVR